MSLPIIAVMAIAGIGAIVGITKQKAGAAWGQPVAILCALIGIGAALSSLFGGGSSNGTATVEGQYRNACGQKVGEYLNKNFSGKKFIIIANPDQNETVQSYNKAIISGLKKQLKGDIQVITPTVPQSIIAKYKKANSMMGGPGGPGGPDAAETEMFPTPDYWFTSSVLKGLDKKFNGCIIISTVGIPSLAELFKTKFLKSKKSKTKLAIATQINAKSITPYFGGSIVAAVHKSPKAVYDSKKLSSDFNKGFDKRFILITDKNYTTTLR